MRYTATIKVLVTLRIRESPTTQSSNTDWSVGADVPGSGRRLEKKRAAAAFVRDAVASWGGQAPPDYVFFPTNLRVTARAVKRA